MAHLSLAARTMKAVTRRTVRPLLNPAVPLRLQRNGLAVLAKSAIKPRGVDYAAAEVSGVRCLTAKCRVKKPAKDAVVMYLHGGAYCVGTPAVYQALLGRLSLGVGCEVIAPDYRLAPEHPFPAAIDDAVSVYNVLREQYVRVYVMGDSAGGGLSLAMTLALREQSTVLPDKLVLLSPWLDLTCSSPSHDQYKRSDAVLTAAWLRWCGQHYRGVLPETHAGCSPLFADVSGLPPTLIQVGEDEILFNDAESLTERLQAAQVDVVCTVYSGMWHVFQAQAGVVPEATQAVRSIAEFLE